MVEYRASAVSPGRRTRFDWHGRRASAWLPAPLADRTFPLREPTVRATERAAAALRLSEQRLPADWEPLARLMLRTEGIASSSIEGITGPLEEIVVAELAQSQGEVGWVADNLAVVQKAMSVEIVTEHLLLGWHRELMRHSRLPGELVGAYRDAPGWIGGTSPLDAAYVPPLPEHLPMLMVDLMAALPDERFDPVTQAAVVHGQFETIHPFGDGNGRLGRVLIGWVLRHRGVVDRLPPPISVMIAKDPGGYLAGLYEFREGDPDRWVRWFAGTTRGAATAVVQMVSEVEAILDGYRDALTDLRSDAAAHRLVPLLPHAPVLDASTAASLLDVSVRTARRALRDLANRQILYPVDVFRARQGRPANYYVARALLDTNRRWTR